MGEVGQREIRTQRRVIGFFQDAHGYSHRGLVVLNRRRPRESFSRVPHFATGPGCTREDA